MIYNDVRKDDWAYGVINKASKLGLMNGFPGNLFKPDDKPDRRQLAALALRIFNFTIHGERLNEVVDKVRKSVVQLRNPATDAIGSGVFISADTILTNFHVVDGTHQIIVDPIDGVVDLVAEVIKLGKKDKDDQSGIDLALVKTNLLKGKYGYVSLAESEDSIDEGDFAIAVGSPYGLDDSVTFGVVSNLSRGAYIQIDTPINPGNSGGGLFNLNGELIGINTAKIGGSDGTGFAIRLNELKKFIS